MGNNATVRTDEDELCALHLRNLLEGRRGDSRAVCQVILGVAMLCASTIQIDRIWIDAI
jgi:hypothetical protein